MEIVANWVKKGRLIGIGAAFISKARRFIEAEEPNFSPSDNTTATATSQAEKSALQGPRLGENSKYI
ncbi:hypothetical protein CRG98_028812 [Punica granatum]|uniref:Uncharacterized protein n=1 Tax=Punica granatum TaxID=22663 RepID=A0A2I0J3L0_PUNGR|nr:hypothetical protein CRG98_028812 [Punica granatum]